MNNFENNLNNILKDIKQTSTKTYYEIVAERLNAAYEARDKDLTISYNYLSRRLPHKILKKLNKLSK